MRQRFRDQILHDVAHGLIPRAVDEALRERGVEPVDTPDIRDVVVEEGQPLKFTATLRDGAADRAGRLREHHAAPEEHAVDDAAVEEALASLRDRAARYEPVEGRGIEIGDSVVMDLDADGDAEAEAEEPLVVIAGEPPAPKPRRTADRHATTA